MRKFIVEVVDDNVNMTRILGALYDAGIEECKVREVDQLTFESEE